MGSVRCMVNQFRRWGKSMRVWMVFVLFAIFISTNFCGSIRAFCQQYDVACSVWLMPLILAKMNHKLWIMLLPILLFCDAPFLDEQQPFLIVRIGRLRWAVGEILYILLASAVFYLGCMLVSVLLISPYVEFTTGWGRVLRTLTQASVASPLQMDAIMERVILAYTAPEATLLCGIATWIATSFLGLLMFLCNLWARREVGIIVAAIFVGLSYFIDAMGYVSRLWNTARYVSPVSWVDLNIVGMGTFRSPSWSYIIVAGCVLLAVLIAAILLSVRRKSIDIVQSI
ncbi:MAG TPA: hypothetical protein IAA32_00695 [Candidatus Butyricicoccus stercorigallinarum]|nr:hypothetical protein [Candidatus Butyricicoccus stercorigallinarum]